MKHYLPSTHKSLSVNILLFDKFSNMLLASLLEPLRVVRDNSGEEVSWIILTHGDRPVRSSSGLTVVPELPAASAPACDVLILIGGDQFRRDAKDPMLRQRLKFIHRSDCIIAADTGAWLLAAAGYLSGRCATLHWQLLSEFAETFPDVTVVADRFTSDGKYMTCGSASTALDLILEQISARFGQAARFDAASMFLNNPVRAEAYRSSYGDGLSHGNPTVHRIVSIMVDNIEEPLSLTNIALEANISLRTMARLIVAELGMSPGRCYQQLRMARARDLIVHTKLSLASIALKCGFSSAQALSRAFLNVHGMSPRA